MDSIRAFLRSTTALTRAAAAGTTGRLARFARAEGGAVAIIFGLVMVPVIGLAGAALDYSRASEDQSTTLAAADSAALAAVRSLRQSDAEVRAYVVERYGNFVLLKPPVEGDTLLLWAGPFAVLLLGAAGLVLWRRKAPAATPDAAPLTDAERAELDRRT